MNPFHHRGFIRKRKNKPQAPRTDYFRVQQGLPVAGRFAEPTKNAGLQMRDAWAKPVDNSVENYSWSNVVNPTLTRHNEVVKGKEEKMNKSHRVAMAQALLAELSEATARHGAGNDGVKRLHRLVASMVAQLLA